ncbi:zinc finger BED domain-containing protein DAYSLEEPER-like [Vicia villosa]|uniref:zinc finger BED domain-containing protein DAYSLEEPER-like n=1 Tax=Vicia villosa TaxID=3911 RepID=UPI00273BDB66|nr:zinc finger BED domain-containing protein DAYSLEEPER-like [Vicia villosa]
MDLLDIDMLLGDIGEEETTGGGLDGIKKWKCRWCAKLYTYDTKWKSTYNGKKNLESCIQRKLIFKGNNDKEVARSRLNIGDTSTPSLATWTYNHARVREIAAHMILGHEFPFSVMEGVIFNEFFKEIYPWYKKITRQQVKFDCDTFYEAERVKMKRFMDLINRVSLTTDLWWSGEQRVGYMTATDHFIDLKWKLHKRVLSFKNVPPPHSGEVLWRDLIKDGLDMIKVTVDKIRNGVKYFPNSEKRCKAFKKFVDELQLEGRMQGNGAFLSFLPEANDWEDVHDIFKFLEVFADVTSIISGTSYPTPNLFLAKLYRVKVLLDKPSCTSSNPQLQAFANEMKLKYDKYWSESNTLISIGAVLDPSAYDEFYLMPIMFGLLYTYGTNDEVTPIVSESPEVGSTSRLGRRNFERFLETVVGNNNSKSDLELYLEDPPLKVPPKAKFNVLTWWMGNQTKYPVLSKLVNDIITVPVTTVSLEATFSAGKRVINPKQSSMKTKTIEMVLCGGDWVKEKYGIKKGCTASILEEPQDEPLTFNFGEDPGVSSSTTAT